MSQHDQSTCPVCRHYCPICGHDMRASHAPRCDYANSIQGGLYTMGEQLAPIFKAWTEALHRALVLLQEAMRRGP